MSPQLSLVIPLLLALLTSELVARLLVTLLCKGEQDLPKRQQERNNRRTEQTEDRTYHWRVRSGCECKLAFKLLLWTRTSIVSALCTVKQADSACISKKQGGRIGLSLYLTSQTCLRVINFWQLPQQKHLERSAGPGCALQECCLSLMQCYLGYTQLHAVAQSPVCLARLADCSTVSLCPAKPPARYL